MMDNNTALKAYFQQQQTPPGWFDLLTIMIDGMIRNAGERESQPFLRQMGETLADAFPLPEAQTLGDLEQNINHLLATFNWGVVAVSVGELGLVVRHQALPVSRNEDQQVRWCNAFCAILEGLYARWLQGQGGEAHLLFQREQLFSVDDVQFRYFNP
ncbi:cellulose synthase [Superficieibacter electus]|uniref:Cellulose synthase n=2 Tax=Superficieibacter electus TaxID=2022662 RepID=A0A2P5GPM4_9ENTR|nr:cellulose biosynthesis protein BcsD [Superficieibacter electus]POP45233.1 cellulose synthase [Superficieibacter electus]POP48517.1 cellulose synthase [Superficieibacter electus]